MLKEREDRAHRLWLSILALVIGAVFMVAGALLVGDWSDSLTTSLKGDRLRLEAGILLLLAGAIDACVVLTYLMPRFRR